MADVNLNPGSMASVGGPLTDRAVAMTAPGTVPGDDPAGAPRIDERRLEDAEPGGGHAEGRWDDVSGRREPWRP